MFSIHLTVRAGLTYYAETIRIRQKALTIVNDMGFGEGVAEGDPWLPPARREFAARLRAAEDRVFPLAMTDTDRYERAVTLVGLLRPVVVQLAPDLDALEGCQPLLLAHVRDLASRHAVVTADLDLPAVVDAARAQRLRMLLATAGEQSTDAVIEQARAAGLAWAVVAEPAAADLGIAPQQQWIDLHLATGTRLIRTIRMDAGTGRALFQVDLRSPDGQGMSVECADRAEWLVAAEDLRADLDSVT